MAFFSTMFVLMIILPVVFWIWFFLSGDVTDKEPKMMIFRLFLKWGIFSTVLALSFSYFLGLVIPGFSDVAQSTILKGGGLTSTSVAYGLLLCIIFEELAKFGILWTVTYESRYFTQIVDGVIYGVAIALGFSFFENVLYFYEFMDMNLSKFEFFYIVLARAVNPTVLHLVTTGIAGLYMGKKKFSAGHNKSYLVKGISIAIIIHTLFNLSIFMISGPISQLLAFSVVISGLSYLIWEASRPENRMIWKLSGQKS